MRYLKYLALLTILIFPAAALHAQVGVGVQVGPAYGYYNYPGYYNYTEPVCTYGYYPYYPYACAPYGYWGPDWFLNGVFIGAGPWYHSHYFGHPDFAHQGFYGRGGWGGYTHQPFRGEGGFRGSNGLRAGNNGFIGGNRGFRGGNRGFAGGGFRGSSGFHGGGARGGSFHGGGGFHAGGGFHGGSSHGGGGRR